MLASIKRVARVARSWFLVRRSKSQLPFATTGLRIPAEILSTQPACQQLRFVESFCHRFVMNQLAANKGNPVARYYTASAVRKTENVLNAPKRMFTLAQPFSQMCSDHQRQPGEGWLHPRNSLAANSCWFGADQTLFRRFHQKFGDVSRDSLPSELDSKSPSGTQRQWIRYLFPVLRFGPRSRECEYAPACRYRIVRRERKTTGRMNARSWSQQKSGRPWRPIRSESYRCATRDTDRCLESDRGQGSRGIHFAIFWAAKLGVCCRAIVEMYQWIPR